MSKKGEIGPVGGMILAIVALCTFVGMLTPSSNSNSSSPSSTSTNNFIGSMTDEERFGHAYTQIRMREEGFSSREAKQAADAVIKFHRKQNQ